MRKFLAALLAGALVLVGCSESPPDPASDPKGALREAVEALADEPVTVTVSLEGDPSEVPSSAELSPAAAQALFDSAIVISTNGKSGEDGLAEFSIETGGTAIVEAVVEADSLYLRADVPRILEMAGEDPAKLDAKLAQIPPGLEFVRDAAAGEWIHLSGLSQAGAMTGQQGTEEQQEEARKFFEDLIDEHVNASEGDEEGPGTHVEAEIAIKEAFADIMAFAQNAVKGGGLPAPGFGTAPTEEIPEGPFILDTWIEDGELTQVRVDLAKNAESFGEEAPEGPTGILAEVEDWDEEVETPSDATEVSFQELMGAFMSLAFWTAETSPPAGGAPGSGQDMTDVCAEISQLPPEQQAAFKDLCPNG